MVTQGVAPDTRRRARQGARRAEVGMRIVGLGGRGRGRQRGVSGAKRRRLGQAWVAAFGGAVVLLALTASTPPASADVVTPAGECVGSGTWQKSGLRETSTAHASN